MAAEPRKLTRPTGRLVSALPSGASSWFPLADPAELVKNERAGSGLYFCADQIVGKVAVGASAIFCKLSVQAGSVRAEFMLGCAFVS
jgi:hypothetical protein